MYRDIDRIEPYWIGKDEEEEEREVPDEGDMDDLYEELRGVEL